MTAWLGATVKGEELAGNVDDGGRRLIADDGGRDAVPATMGTSRDTDKEEKVPTTTEGVMMDNKVRTYVYLSGFATVQLLPSER